MSWVVYYGMVLPIWVKSHEIPWNPKCWWSNHHQWMARFGCKSQCVLLLSLARAQPKRHQETIGSMGPGSQANDASGPGAGWLWRWFMWEDHGVIFGGSLLWGTGGGISLGQCKWCCMIWLPLNLFQERRCHVFSPSCYIHVCWRYFEAELSWSESGLVAIHLMIGLLHASFTVALKESIVILTQAKLQLLGRPRRQTLRKRQSMDLRPPSLLSTLCPSYFAYGCIAAYDKKQ